MSLCLSSLACLGQAEVAADRGRECFEAKLKAIGHVQINGIHSMCFFIFVPSMYVMCSSPTAVSIINLCSQLSIHRLLMHSSRKI